MDNNEITARLNEIELQLTDDTKLRRDLSHLLAVDIGTDEKAGIDLDNLTKWARQIKKVNTRMKALADERRELREIRRKQTPCVCGCHKK
ncbi:MAG: hypothetical protein EBS31_07225 [Burkholderiaceae bacterium]|nr:hypothetical protein [Burkholderiaceae bacterium]